jgi:hypothetical protein
MKIWKPGDPEPGPQVRMVRTLGEYGWRYRWRRFRVQGRWKNPDYHWFNGDKARTWPMLSSNWGPLVDHDAQARMYRAYDARRRNRVKRSR